MTNWTKNDIPDLKGKVFIVTGANSGTGYESALALAEKGATVVMACRNPKRAQDALAAIQRTVPDAKVEWMELDLASLKSIRGFAEAFQSRFDRLDVLLNNGGVMGPARSVTQDGFETQFGVNDLGPFALTGLLLSVLLKTPASRVVNVSSRMHTTGKIAWDDLMSEQHYDNWAAYRQSKLGILLFTFEFNRRAEANGTLTRAIAVHPGLVASRWVENNLKGFQALMMKAMSPVVSQSPAMAALPLLYAAVDAHVQPGSYYGPDHDTRGYPVVGRAAEAAYSESDAKRLWEISAKLTGVKYEGLNGDRAV